MESRLICFGVNKSGPVLSSAREQEKCVQRIKKGKISSFAINDYIVDVSSAYHALKKEIALSDDSLKKFKQMTYPIIEQINEHWRETFEKDGPVYSMPASSYYDKAMHSGGISYFRYITILYRAPSRHPEQLNLDMKIVRLKYYSYCYGLAYQEYARERYNLKNITGSLKNHVMHVVKKGRPVCVEFYSPHAISDWIVIKNNFDPINDFLSVYDLELV
jgi:hypothetical protein